ncbi:Unknown protein, partial [Striga hermonthica]
YIYICIVFGFFPISHVIAVRAYVLSVSIILVHFMYLVPCIAFYSREELINFPPQCRELLIYVLCVSVCLEVKILPTFFMGTVHVIWPFMCEYVQVSPT